MPHRRSVTDGASRALSEPAAPEDPWWADAVGYEVYLRSFADGDGDGIGDLPGLAERLPHLADLGVDLVWITPFYPSPMADFGYDVADHCAVDPRFGTMADLDRVVAGAHASGMRVVIDLVPNHTSDQHPWFRSARAGRDSPERDLYLWRDPAPDGGPPNNWRSHFGGPAWTLDEASGQYWCHLFLPEQPDLNWANPRVWEEFRAILRFWLDRGVDGFRIDVAHSLVKDPDLRDNPVLHDAGPGASPRDAFAALRHDHDLDQPGVLDVYRDWHRITGPRGAVLLGEVYLEDPAAVARYVADGDAVDLSFYFPVLDTAWDPVDLRSVVIDALEHGRGRFAWVHSSHDDPRAPSRFGGGEVGRDRALAFLVFTAFLPGPLFLYQGDELGLVDGVIDPSRTSDPVAVRNPGASGGRDPVRTPMPWLAGAPHLGFSSVEPWLPLGENRTDADTVSAQLADPASRLHRCRRLLELRRELSGRATSVEWIDTHDDVLAYRRGDVTVAMNAGPEAADVTLDAPSVIRLEHGGATVDGTLHLPPAAAAVLTEKDAT
jgi:alpha-glucosidase